MKSFFYFIVCIVIFIPSALIGQNKSEVDIIHLKNGAIVSGYIIDSLPNIEVKFRSLDGSVIVYPYLDIIKIEKEVLKNKIHVKTVFDTQSFFITGLGIHPSQTSFFVMAGKVKRFGYYAQLKSNLRFNSDYDYEGGKSTYAFFNGKSSKGRFSILGGGLIRISSPLICYFGAGYGSRWVNWELVTGQKFRVNDISYKGVEVETGLIVKYKGYTVNVGITSTTFKYFESNIGFGFCF